MAQSVANHRITWCPNASNHNYLPSPGQTQMMDLDFYADGTSTFPQGCRPHCTVDLSESHSQGLASQTQADSASLDFQCSTSEHIPIQQVAGPTLTFLCHACCKYFSSIIPSEQQLLYGSLPTSLCVCCEQMGNYGLVTTEPTTGSILTARNQDILTVWLSERDKINRERDIESPRVKLETPTSSSSIPSTGSEIDLKPLRDMISIPLSTHTCRGLVQHICAQSTQLAELTNNLDEGSRSDCLNSLESALRQTPFEQVRKIILSIPDLFTSTEYQDLEAILNAWGIISMRPVACCQVESSHPSSLPQSEEAGIIDQGSKDLPRAVMDDPNAIDHTSTKQMANADVSLSSSRILKNIAPKGGEPPLDEESISRGERHFVQLSADTCRTLVRQIIGILVPAIPQGDVSKFTKQMCLDKLRPWLRKTPCKRLKEIVAMVHHHFPEKQYQSILSMLEMWELGSGPLEANGCTKSATPPESTKCIGDIPGYRQSVSQEQLPYAATVLNRTPGEQRKRRKSKKAALVDGVSAGSNEPALKETSSTPRAYKRKIDMVTDR